MPERIAQKDDLHLFEFMVLKWEWSYGDSNPRPLACHEARTLPATSANAP